MAVNTAVAAIEFTRLVNWRHAKTATVRSLKVDKERGQNFCSIDRDMPLLVVIRYEARTSMRDKGTRNMHAHITIFQTAGTLTGQHALHHSGKYFFSCYRNL